MPQRSRICRYHQEETEMRKLFKNLCLAAALASVVAGSFAFTACGHKHIADDPVRENEVEATCQHGGSYDEVVFCYDCEKELSRTHKTTEKTDHKPAEPIKENEVAASCSSAGSYTEVIKCKDCDTEISRTQKTTEKTQHVYAETLSKDKTGHWYQCENCTDKKDFHEHVPGPAATETTSQICTECEYVISLPVGHIHTPTKVEAVEAGCTTGGNIAYYVCSCGNWYSDENAENEITDHTSVNTSPKGHKWDEGKTTAEGVVYTCSSCKQTKTAKEYVFEAEYTNLKGLKGKGYSNDASGTGLIVRDTDGEIGVEGLSGASNGFFISYFYVRDLTLTFKINSDTAVEDAKLSLRLSGELLETIELTDEEFLVKANGDKLNFDKIVIDEIDTDMSNEVKREFQDFYVTTPVSLVEGENIITLTVNNSKKMVGAIGCTAPLIDCIKVETTAELSWDPILKNLSKWMDE